MEKPAVTASESAERAILGCILSDNALINEVSEKLHIDDFYYPRHQCIYAGMLTLSTKLSPIDYQTLSEQMIRDGKLDEIGGVDYILAISNEIFYTSNLSNYLSIVKNYALSRELMGLGEDVNRRAKSGEESPLSILESLETEILRISENRLAGGLTPLSETLTDTLKRLSDLSMQSGTITGLSSGYRNLDSTLSGLQASDLILLAARPSMGKTALGVNIGYNVARKKNDEGEYNNVVAIFSLEMSKLQLSQRLLAMESGIELQKIISGDISGSDAWNAIMNAMDEMRRYHIFVDDTSSLSIQELRSKCRRLKIERGLDLIVVDYLQLMTVDNMHSGENRQQEISTISRGLKALAKEMNCPLLALSQLSRKTETREKARPMMSDMRESGAIEQDADVVMLLYREDYYDQETERKNITEVIIAKHRNGPTGKVELYFNKPITKFSDLSYDEDPNA